MPGDINNKLAYVVYLRHLFAYEAASDLLKNQKKILEIGSGEGYGAAYLSEGPFDITCYDLSEEIAKHATKNYSKNNLRFSAFDGKRIPEADNTFDAVISFQVIEHVPDVNAYLKEINRVLKPGGIFICTTPNRFYRLRPGQKPWNNFHLREYYDHELQKDLATVFSKANVWGIRGNDELQKMEHNRVKKSRDNSPLKKLIPFGIRKWIKSKTIGKSKPVNTDTDFKEKYSLNDYRIIKENVNQDSLDLLGYCTK